MKSEKPRLCIVTPNHWSASMGGAEYQIQCLLEALKVSSKYEIYYLTQRVASDAGSPEYRIVKIGRKYAFPGLGFLSDAIPLTLALNCIRPHTIYQRVACGYTGIVAHYARRHGARMIWHVAHDTDVIPGKSLDAGRNFIRRILEKRSIEYGIRRAHSIVVQTEHQARLLEANYHRRADCVIPNFHPEPIEPIDKSGPISILWVANLKPWKQPEVFLRLAESLGALNNATFTMIGELAMPGSPADRQWSDTLLKNIEKSKNICYLGKRTQAEVNLRLASAHIFVNTSLHEGFANTFIQAWQRGVPVVSLHANPDGVLERNGIGICAGSESGLLDAVRRLILSPQLRDEYATRARAYASKFHSFLNAEALARLVEGDETN